MDFPLHDGQKEFIESLSRITVVTAGTGGGKTSGAYHWLHQRMLIYPHRSWFVGFPSYKLLDRVVINPVDPDRLTLIQYLDEMGENPQLHKMEAWIECISGNILFASAENLQAWVGSHVAGFWIDEFDECPLEAFRMGMERTRLMAGERNHEKGLGQLLLTGTPRNIKWIKTELLPEWEKGNRDYVRFIRFPSTANPRYSAEIMEEARRTLPSWEYRRLYEGELADKEGGNLFHREWWKRYSAVFKDNCWYADIGS